MTRKEIIIKAIEGKLTWLQAATILGMTARNMRRLEVDLEEYERTQTPLLGCRSHEALGSFHVILVSISFEPDYVNFLKMLIMSPAILILDKFRRGNQSIQDKPTYLYKCREQIEIIVTRITHRRKSTKRIIARRYSVSSDVKTNVSTSYDTVKNVLRMKSIDRVEAITLYPPR